MMFDVNLTPQQKEELLKEGCCHATSESYFITGKELRKEQETWSEYDESKNVALEDDMVYWWGDGIEAVCSLDELKGDRT